MHRRHFVTALGAACLSAPALHAQERLENVLDRYAQMQSFQLRRGDDMLVAVARRQGGIDRIANIKSCSKSIVALLLGAAVARGEITTGTTLAQAAPDLIPRDATEGVGAITMEDLVTMRAGLASTSGRNYGAWVSSGNWVAYALRQPMEDRPGGRMIYSTGSTHVLGAVLAKVTGQSLLAQARARLGQPMGIEVPAWTADPQGYYFGGNEMGLTPRAMQDLAVMMRDGGAFGGRQVVAEEWVRASTRPRTQSPWSGMGYGYGWFVTQSGYRLARGYGGQVIAAHPERKLAVAITSDPTQPARSGGYFSDIMDVLERSLREA